MPMGTGGEAGHYGHGSAPVERDTVPEGSRRGSVRLVLMSLIPNLLIH